jgi:hypothetical protein
MGKGWSFLFVSLVAFLAIRFLWLESGVAPLACGGAWQPELGWPCVAKFLLVQAFIEERTGWVALALAVVAHWRGRRGLALLALWLGLFATVFYSATTGVIAALLALPSWFGESFPAGKMPGQSEAL